MTARVRFRPQARAELEEARAWYEARLSGLGRDFVEAVDALVGRIAEMPQAFSPLRSDVRQAIMEHFPYSLLFSYEHDEVIVLTVHHHRRKPSRWHRPA